MFDEVPEDWTIAEDSAERVVLLRPYAEAVPESESLPDRPGFMMRLFVVDPPSVANVAQWYPVYERDCTFRVPLPGAGNADFAMAADTRAHPEATHIDLRIFGGHNEEAEVVAVRETSETVELAIGVTCIDVDRIPPCGGPGAGRFMDQRVELAAPLGDREVVDVARIPAEPVRPGRW